MENGNAKYIPLDNRNQRINEEPNKRKRRKKVSGALFAHGTGLPWATLGLLKIRMQQ